MTRTTQFVSLISLYESEKILTIVKHKANKERKPTHIALLSKLLIITIICVLISFIVISIFGIHFMKTTSQKLADTIGVEKIDNDIEKTVNSNIVKYIIKMTVITFAFLLVFIALLIIGYKYKFLSHRVK